MHEDNENEYYEVVRKQNRVLRRSNKILRGALKNSKEYADALFLELCGENTFDDSESFDDI